MQDTQVVGFVLCLKYFFLIWIWGKKTLPPHKRGTLSKNVAAKGLKEQVSFSNATP